MQCVRRRGPHRRVRRFPSVVAFRSPIVALAMAGLCAACAVGPDFKRPAAPVVTRYTADPLPPQTAGSDTPDGAVQTFVAETPLPAHWWTLFGSPALESLVEESLRANPTIQSAQATLREARENVLAARGVLFPAVSGSASGERQRISGADFGPFGTPSTYNLYNASVSVSYALDLFGGARRDLEALEAQTDYQRYVLDAAYLTLAGNVVTTAIAEGSLRAQILATKNLIEASTRRLRIIEAQVQTGGASPADVLAEEAELAQDREALPALESQLDHERTLLATLLGRLPSEGPELKFELGDLRLPETLPVSLPSQLVAQRPDIRQQEALLHAASAEIGVATANMLPQLSLGATVGGASISAGTLFSGPNAIWSLSAGVTQPLFEGGQLLHRRRAAVAAYQAAAAQYRETVLTAFRNVADSLRALTADGETLAAAAQAEHAAAGSLAIIDRQFTLGAASYLALLTAQRTEQQSRIALIQAEAARLADTAALFQALGGADWSEFPKR